MNIDEFIDKIETEYLEDVLKRLSLHSPDKIISLYLSALEFKRAKLMRGNAIPENDDSEKDIKIELITSNPNLPKNG